MFVASTRYFDTIHRRGIWAAYKTWVSLPRHIYDRLKFVETYQWSQWSQHRPWWAWRPVWWWRWWLHRLVLAHVLGNFGFAWWSTWLRSARISANLTWTTRCHIANCSVRVVDHIIYRSYMYSLYTIYVQYSTMYKGTYILLFGFAPRLLLTDYVLPLVTENSINIIHSKTLQWPEKSVISSCVSSNDPKAKIVDIKILKVCKKTVKRHDLLIFGHIKNNKPSRSYTSKNLGGHPINANQNRLTFHFRSAC